MVNKSSSFYNAVFQILASYKDVLCKTAQQKTASQRMRHVHDSGKKTFLSVEAALKTQTSLWIKELSDFEETPHKLHYLS